MKVLVELMNGNIKEYEAYTKVKSLTVIDDNNYGRYKITPDMEIEYFPPTTAEQTALDKI